MTERALRLIDTETGEVTDRPSCPECQRMEDVIKGLQTNVAGWAAKYGELKRDKDREAREHAMWPVALEHFKVWQRECGHPNSEWTAGRFWLILPFLKRKKYAALIPRAIAGAAYDPFIVTRKNGSKQRFDGWELLFRDTGKFESFVCKSPREQS